MTETTVIRRIGNKRTRTLRRKGVRVWWCEARESYVWEMRK